MLIRPARRPYQDWITDSRRWDRYVARPDDIIIATAPKCGTTWVQRIVGLLIFNDPAPRSVDDESPWVDLRLAPLDEVVETLANQRHRRYLKAHLPLDCLPLHDDVRYIHVARDGRDACMSIHNMVMGTVAMPPTNAVDPESPSPYAAIPESPRDYFRTWLTSSVTEDQSDGAPFLSFFDLEVTYWKERSRSNLLLVHYNDLKTDLDAEMRRIAAFLGTPIDETIWSDLVNAATFAEMKKAGARIKPHVVRGLTEGADRFFNKGVSEGWKEHLTESDLALYRAKVRDKFTPGLAAWIEKGRLGAGDPREGPE